LLGRYVRYSAVVIDIVYINFTKICILIPYVSTVASEGNRDMYMSHISKKALG